MGRLSNCLRSTACRDRFKPCSSSHAPAFSYSTISPFHSENLKNHFIVVNTLLARSRELVCGLGTAEAFLF